MQASYISHLVGIVVVARLLSRNVCMVKNHGALEVGNSPGPGPEVVERQRVAKERAAQKVRSWTVQNEMRGVLGRVFVGVT